MATPSRPSSPLSSRFPHGTSHPKLSSCAPAASVLKEATTISDNKNVPSPCMRIAKLASRHSLKHSRRVWGVALLSGFCLCLGLIVECSRPSFRPDGFAQRGCATAAAHHWVRRRSFDFTSFESTVVKSSKRSCVHGSMTKLFLAGSTSFSVRAVAVVRVVAFADGPRHGGADGVRCVEVGLVLHGLHLATHDAFTCRYEAWPRCAAIAATNSASRRRPSRSACCTR